MMWSDTPCRTTCWNAGNKTELALRNPEIECIVTQHPWFENDTPFSDIILPTNTHMEVDEIIPNWISGVEIPSLILADKAVEPIGESKSDFDAVAEVAKHFGLYEEIIEGLETDRDAVKYIFDYCVKDSPHEHVTWEQFKEATIHFSTTMPMTGKRSHPDSGRFMRIRKSIPSHGFRQDRVLFRSVGQTFSG